MRKIFHAARTIAINHTTTRSHNNVKRILESQKLRRTVLGAYLTLVLMLLFTPVASGLPSEYYTWFDKVVHFVMFAGLALIGYWNVGSITLVVLFTVTLAGGTELLQGFLPFRSREIWDFLAGAGGALAGVGVLIIQARRK
ncbi:MAG: VanZ family protein [Gemmatimonadales bacterium]